MRPNHAAEFLAYMMAIKALQPPEDVAITDRHHSARECQRTALALCRAITDAATGGFAPQSQMDVVVAGMQLKRYGLLLEGGVRGAPKCIQVAWNNPIATAQLDSVLRAVAPQAAEYLKLFPQPAKSAPPPPRSGTRRASQPPISNRRALAS